MLNALLATSCYLCYSVFMVEKNEGFSLIEVLVFISILSIFFIAAITVSVASLKHMKVNEHRMLATRYAEELAEWIRTEKDINWDNFVSKAGGNNGNTYCFNDQITSATDFPAVGNCAAPYYTGITGTNPLIFKREVTLTKQGSPVYQVNVTVLTEWLENGVPYSVPIQQVYTIWE